MSSLAGFDANNVKPDTGFDPIPVGRYSVVITESLMKPTKNGEGEYLQLSVQVVDGEYANRKLWERLNLKNKNAQAVTIAQAQLSAICRAVGIMTPQDSAELHNIVCEVEVGMEKGQNPGDMQNKIKKWLPKAGGGAHVHGQAATVAQTVTQAPAPAAGKPAWAK